MREIVQTLLGSRVPVVVHVAPAGARAASAGMFVTLAASVAAMAPGTAIGAAHPVMVGRAKADPAMEDKVVNDAAAFARAIAAIRHRNTDWPERAVRESVSLTSDEALRERVIDLVALDVPDLLRQLDGRSVATASGDRPLHTAGLNVDARPMLVSERIVQIVSDPNVAYLLFLLGLLGIAAELYHPGTFVPGTLGAIALVLALVAFGNLPISWAGIVLILLAIGLFVGELHTGVGILAALAVVALVMGSLLLYSPPEPAAPGPTVRVSPALVAVMSATVAAFFLLVVRATLRARHLAVRTGIPVLVGQVGVATSELAPAGTVRVDSEVWSAESEGGPIHAGERVTVVGGAGVTLRVTKSQGEAAWNRSSATSS
jgi:membrane-bound serine protease (ClpP class)